MQQLDLIATIDRHAGKRPQGVSVGTYIALAALNRCLAPTSKARFAEWYQATVLRRLLPVASRQLTSQRFWDHMSYLDTDKISAIETDLTRTLIERFALDLSCLLYDTTNFYTFIDSFHDAPRLAQRGKSKEKRTDLRIVGLALLVTQDFHIPLVHHVYPGNTHDAPTFASVTETLVARYRRFSAHVAGITLVYDKGNNSADNQAALDQSSYHFVGSLSPAQHPDLLRIPRARFEALEGEDLEGVLAWRTRKHVLGAERTLVVTYHPELFLTQSATILREVRKRTRKLKDPNSAPEVVWLVTSLSAEQANEERLLELARAYWGIENGGHGRLDGSAFEDGCRVRHPVAATALGWPRRFVQGEYAAWSRRQPCARDRTQPTFFARIRGDPATAVRFVTTLAARL